MGMKKRNKNGKNTAKKHIIDLMKVVEDAMQDTYWTQLDSVSLIIDQCIWLPNPGQPTYVRVAPCREMT